VPAEPSSRFRAMERGSGLTLRGPLVKLFSRGFRTQTDSHGQRFNEPAAHRVGSPASVSHAGSTVHSITHRGQTSNHCMTGSRTEVGGPAGRPPPYTLRQVKKPSKTAMDRNVAHPRDISLDGCHRSRPQPRWWAPRMKVNRRYRSEAGWDCPAHLRGSPLLPYPLRLVSSVSG